jgi:hypothetical protein
MFRSVKGTFKTLSVAGRKFSTNMPPQNAKPSNLPSSSKNNNSSNLYLTIGAVAACGVTFMAYKMESDPVFAAQWANTPGIGLLSPVRSAVSAAGVGNKTNQ